MYNGIYTSIELIEKQKESDCKYLPSYYAGYMS